MISPHEVVEAVRRAQETPVTYDRIEGVKCPLCGEVLPTRGCGVYRTTPWGGNARVRYHTCPKCAFGFKSTEEA